MIRAAKPPAAVAALTMTLLTASAVPALGATASVATADPLAALRGRRPLWHPCTTGPGDTAGAGLDAARARSTEVTVPLDCRRPDGRTLSIALSRLPATDLAHRLGTLFYNPGGSGVLARALALRQAAPALGEVLDAID